MGLGDTEVISGYGWRKTGDKVELFPGYTFKHEDGAEITAMKAGKVVYVGNDLTTGQKTIIIRSKNNTEQIAYSGFGSLAGFKVNDNIQAGDVLGKASSSGEISILVFTLVKMYQKVYQHSLLRLTTTLLTST